MDAHLFGKLAVSFNIEGAQALGTDLALVSMFYDLGVRWLLMAYNCANAVGGGCHDTVDNGLTAFGHRFGEEMDRVGMIKDVSPPVSAPFWRSNSRARISTSSASSPLFS